jgi:hypothetical protein
VYLVPSRGECRYKCGEEYIGAGPAGAAKANGSKEAEDKKSKVESNGW